MKTDGKLLDEFASTFKEWHYFVGGGAVGFLAGILVALYVVVRLFRAEQARRTARRRRDRRGMDGETWL